MAVGRPDVSPCWRPPTACPPACNRTSPAGFWIFGEGVDGAMARRRYRVRPCGRARRLTPLADGEDPEIEDAFRPLFPVHQTPRDAGDGAADERDAAPSPASTDTAAAGGQIVAA